MTSHIRLETYDGIAHIAFTRPDRLNAFDFDMGQQYRDACVAAVADQATRAVLITAEGPAFCAGGDVLAMAQSGAAGRDITDSAQVIHEGIRALTESSVPVVAGVRGAVAGGGIGLMLAADYIVAGQDLRVAGKYAHIGLTPDLGVSSLLTRAIGERRALAMLLTSTEVDAATALDWCLVAELSTEPEVRAADVAREWTHGASHALGQAKRLVRASGQRTVADSLEDEAETIGQAYEREEARHRIGAFAAASAARKAQP